MLALFKMYTSIYINSIKFRKFGQRKKPNSNLTSKKKPNKTSKYSRRVHLLIRLILEH